MRNLDVTTLRSFVAVADTGGVTRAAGLLNLTQSAVSMQLKRLEELLGLDLLDRTGRGVALTAAGEQLLSYARRMVQMNDEIMLRLTDQAYEGEISLGVPHDIVYPVIPSVLQKFAGLYPRMRVNLVSSYTRELKRLYTQGACDVILTTETGREPDGETLTELPLVWIGAPDGIAWRSRPLRLAFGRQCLFRAGAQRALDAAGVAWDMAVESDSDRTIEATLSADLAVTAMILGTEPPHLAQVVHGGALPVLQSQQINLYTADQTGGEPARELATMIREGFADLSRIHRQTAA